MNTISYGREEWQFVNSGEGYTNTLRLQVSNFGHIRSVSGDNKFTVLKGSMINGYKIIRLKLFKPRTPDVEIKLKNYREELAAYEKEIRMLKKIIGGKDIPPDEKSSASQKLESISMPYSEIKKHYQHYLNKETRKRTINFGGLVHRLVAENFLTPPSPEHTFVAHLDYDKLNNVVTNLKWMTKAENVAHQQKSPYVIERKKIRKENQYSDTKASKLTVTKVMFLKKLLNEGKPIASLARQFKVTETQIIRIKRNENWAFVEAAK